MFGLSARAGKVENLSAEEVAAGLREGRMLLKPRLNPIRTR